jgi:hypothetical protein
MIEPFTPGDSNEKTRLEVALPMPLSHGWVAHACRSAGLPKPRWSHIERVWTVEARRGERGEEEVEVIAIREGISRSSVCVEVEQGTGPDTARRVVTALMTGMQWAIARRDGRTRPL